MPIPEPLAAALAEAFDREARAARLFHEAAQRADIEGRAVIAALLRSIAENEAGHANGHLRLMAGERSLVELLRSAIAAAPGVTAEQYEALAAQAEAAGERAVADWLASCAKMERRNLQRLQGALSQIEEAAESP